MRGSGGQDIWEVAGPMAWTLRGGRVGSMIDGDPGGLTLGGVETEEEPRCARKVVALGPQGGGWQGRGNGDGGGNLKCWCELWAKRSEHSGGRNPPCRPLLGCGLQLGVCSEKAVVEVNRACARWGDCSQGLWCSLASGVAWEQSWSCRVGAALWLGARAGVPARR